MKKILAVALVALIGVLSAYAEMPDPIGILKKLDQQTNFTDVDYSCTANLITAKPDKDKEALSIKFFRRDVTDKFLIIIDKPDVKKGQGYLKTDDNVWFYDPNTREFSHSSLKDSFSDSDSRNEDFGRSNLVRDYNVTSFTQEKLGSIDVYKLSLKGKTDTVPTPYKTMWVTVGDVPLIMQEQDYSLSQRLMRTNKYKNYEKINDHYVWKTALFVNNLVAGEFTQLNLKDISLGSIPDKVFTKVYLEQVSR